MKLVIAEKPSVAVTIAKVIGSRTRKNGYYEGNGYNVSWCVGHLIQMASPDKIGEKWKRWKSKFTRRNLTSIENLPIIPEEYIFSISSSLNLIMEYLLRSSDLFFSITIVFFVIVSLYFIL